MGIFLGVGGWEGGTLSLGMETPKTRFSSLFNDSGSIFLVSKESGSGDVDFGGCGSGEVDSEHYLIISESQPPPIN